MKRTVNYKIGALKRKFGTGKADQAPGTFIEKAKQMEEKIINNNQPISKEKFSIMGLV